MIQKNHKEIQQKQKTFRQALQKAQKNNRIIRQLEEWTEEAYEKNDCLNCAHCCKNHSPRFNHTDIRRISKFLSIKESDFISTYLKVDEDEDYVLQKQPCSFLEEDNTCRIYDVRPKDCSRFPYTDEDVFVNQINLSLTNASFCPIAESVLERMSEQYLK